MSRTLGQPRPDSAACMLRAAAGQAGRAYKQGVLDVRPGQTVLDAGCGPGTDVESLADRAGPNGAVIGVDHDPAMLARARARARARVASLPTVDIREADVHALPVEPETVDRARRPHRETKSGRPDCLACATGPDLADWRRVGTALGGADLAAKKRPDAVDARVTLTAARHGSAVIFTSDPGDIHAHLSVLAPSDVHVVTI